ncbi:DNA-binding FadR family transcriptional regulator [Thermosporothrix hazakensis]|jgi:DNA-binding FadR family transcriptional regulator|uniref:DNA-binding FadR family transcriptional regulator n=2 Tax=Thermosporothrix TaxID=768650 RepID=A0A326U8F5_THEHA|nr:FadR/GntR family transcriptional regulator [Thermosporothrix hazakensis]PZW31991.1 DNA-binding FadR family transcriptional regulator [Thermosporothrix hazakensis]BBH91537.1 GntR family transcriptional regulator [Thermosporothrix sp. COM3]GCE49683.1 GntR family transcriptional regulator [Thermosporothrix hazakensis]
MTDKDIAIVETSYRPGYETVADRIIELIQTTGLKPGDRLPTESSLGEQLGVSRAMVREAIKLLTARGYVRTRRGSGIYVTSTEQPLATAAIVLSMPVDHDHMLSLLEFRRLQEMLTARLAAERVTLSELRALENAVEQNKRSAEAGQWDQFIASDIEFHLGIARASHNQFLVDTVNETFRLQRWALKLVIGGTPGSLLLSAEQHAAVLTAIKQGDAEAAVKAMETHILTVQADYQNEVRRLLTSYGGGEQP